MDDSPHPAASSLSGARHPTAAAVEEITGLTFANPGLVVRALTHSSFTNESPGAGENYERLEFLGDAVLDYLAAYWLYQHFPELPEGDLTRMRSALVRTETLAAFAHRLGLNRILRIGKGERLSGGQDRTTILCGAFEALIGAVALDQGVETAYVFLTPFFNRESDRFFEEFATSDAKSLFQEKAQALFGITPGYRVVNMNGPDHDRTYTIEVLVGEEIFGVGTGNSKQIAAQEAARQALQKIEAAGQ
ncbi:MAG: ribonuclease III [Anaerolineales bacterium]|nr:ribonuclease III [Anaerolineales bacterium]